MQLVSVNLGEERSQHNGKVMEQTGIFKQPTEAPVELTALGLVGDCVMDQENHGGPDQAVYVYGEADYLWWSNELGQTLTPGTFGENLTISDLATASLNIGDRLRIGAVVVEVAAPRIPCATLAARMGDPQFVKRFRHAERPGVYCRVIQTGPVRVGDAVSLERYSGATISVVAMYRAWYEPPTDAAGPREILAAPIAIRVRQRYEKSLAELLEAER